MNKILAFDIETATNAPESYKESYNIGVTCIGTAYLGMSFSWTPGMGNGKYQDKFDARAARDFIAYLHGMKSNGYSIVTINGAGFDFRVLAEAAESVEWYDNARDLVLDHYDPAFQLLCQRGFMAGLSAMAAGLGVEGKTEGMSGLKAVEDWKKGWNEQALVLRYVQQDALATYNIVKRIEEIGAIRWISKKGIAQSEPIEKLMTVKEALRLPEPAISGGFAPWPREKFVGWLA